MKSMWSFFENYFTPEECKIITLKCLNKGLKDGFIKGGIGKDGKVDEHFRKVKLVDIFLDEMPELFGKCMSAIQGANSHWFGDIKITGLGYMQFMQYNGTEGGYYREHQDTIWMGTSETQIDGVDENHHRKISFSVQLSDSDDYDGCDLVLSGTDCEQSGPPPALTIRQQGTLFTFPSFMRHAVTPITRGTRYALVGWVIGPTWR